MSHPTEQVVPSGAVRLNSASLVIVFICAIAYVLFQLVQLGYLGQHTDN